ncbi:MAG: GNAT family N-acetyltransferase [Planctomycetota bacterium]
MRFVREATVDDAEDIGTIQVAGWQKAYDGLLPAEVLRGMDIQTRAVRWRATIVDGHPHVLICGEGARVTGFCSWGRSRDEEADDAVAEVWAIYVEPLAWRRGFGRALMERATADAVAAGFTELRLWVLRGNDPAIAFYQSLGFALDGGAKRAPGPGGCTLDELRLARALG